MKKVLSVFAILAAIVSCGKQGPEGPDGPDEPKEELTGADILSFTLVAGEQKIEATVSSYEKRVLIVYMPEQIGLLANASAEVTLSKGATISPDPSQPRDYSVDQVFTVVSGDESNHKSFVVSSEEAKVVNNAKKTWAKSYGSLGITDQVFDQGQSQIGFCDFDKFVTHEGSVFDLEGKKLGKINTSGIPAGWGLISLANDDKGRFIATFGNGYELRNMVDVNNEGAIYIWKDGYDSAPTELYRFNEAGIPVYPQYYWGRSDCSSLSASGDYDGKLMVTTLHFADVAIEGVTTGLHNVLLFDKGELSDFRVFDSRQTLGDGNWTQMISPAEASFEGSFVIGDSNRTGVGYGAFVRKSFDNLAEDYELVGAVDEIPGWDPDASYPGLYGYGNYSVGHVKAFKWFGTDAAIITSTFWEGAFITVRPLDTELKFIVPTEIVSNLHEIRASSAYVFNPADQTGYIVINVGFNSGEVILYKLSRTAI